MNPIAIAILLGGMIVFMLLGIPLAFSIFGISTVVLTLFTRLPPWQLIQRFLGGVDSFVLTAIPFFLLCGNIMNSGKITDKLIELAMTLVGHIRGGLAHVNVLVSLLFGGVSGSAVADTSGIGTVLIPSMIKKGYTKSFSVAVTATSSVLGQIIPPSLIMIIYASTANASVQALFIAGILPGILFALAMMLVSYVYALIYDYPREEKRSFHDFLHAVKESFLVLLMPVIIIGGVLSGVCTATESAVIAVIYSLIITLFVTKTLTFKDLIPLFIDTAKGTATSLLCIRGFFVWVSGFLFPHERLCTANDGGDATGSDRLHPICHHVVHGAGLLYGCDAGDCNFRSHCFAGGSCVGTPSRAYRYDYLSRARAGHGHAALRLVPATWMSDCQD